MVEEDEDYMEDMDDEMAAQWAAMIDDEAPVEETNSRGMDRVLSQDEIDTFLGFNLDELKLSETNGIRALINSAMVSYERLPVLEIVFDRMVRLVTASLRNFTSDNVEVSLDKLTSVRFGDYLNSIPLPAVLAVVRATQLNNLGLFTIDSNLIYSIIDVLLGGGRSGPVRVEGRPYTTIETAIVQQLIELILKDMEQAFLPVSHIDFEIERLETNPRFATITRPADATILVRFRIDMEDRGGTVELLLPYATIEPIKPLLSQMFMGEKFGRDTMWEEHLATEIFPAEIEVEATLFNLPLTLKQVKDMKVGDTLVLELDPGDSVEVNCGGINLTAGRMGQMDHHIAVLVDRPLRKPKMTLQAFEESDDMQRK